MIQDAPEAENNSDADSDEDAGSDASEAVSLAHAKNRRRGDDAEVGGEGGEHDVESQGGDGGERVHDCMQIWGVMRRALLGPQSQCVKRPVYSFTARMMSLFLPAPFTPFLSAFSWLVAPLLRLTPCRFCVVRSPFFVNFSLFCPSPVLCGPHRPTDVSSVSRALLFRDLARVPPFRAMGPCECTVTAGYRHPDLLRVISPT
ncbi:hypothetical protein DFH09DRAFT_1323631 [Mycena vulgaris]|nr:hypothetical protein DFH09DRAFT_1323631 [Mycena vulgaris]